MSTAQGAASANRWILRCAARVVEIDAELSREEALEMARCMHDFERTGAMEPEAAADFVASEMRKSGRTRFERRSAPRTSARWCAAT